MELTTYREIYHKPTSMIPVPEKLQNQAFEVFFAPVLTAFSRQEKSMPIQNSQSHSSNMLKNLVSSWDELPLELQDAFDFADLPADNADIF